MTLRQDFADFHRNTGSLSVTADALVDIRDWTFLIGPGLMPAVNAVLLGTRLSRPTSAP